MNDFMDLGMNHFVASHCIPQPSNLPLPSHNNLDHLVPTTVTASSESNKNDNGPRSTINCHNNKTTKKKRRISDELPSSSSSSSMHGQEMVMIRRARGRPLGSKNKPKPPLIIPRDTPDALRAHILEIAIGCDMVDSLAGFTRRRQLGISIISGSGYVANPMLIQSNTTDVLALHGRFQILSLSAMFLPPPGSNSGVTIYLGGGGHGQVVGGSVIGSLIAATPLILTCACFAKASHDCLPLQKEVEEDAELLTLMTTTPCGKPNMVNEAPRNMGNPQNIPPNFLTNYCQFLPSGVYV